MKKLLVFMLVLGMASLASGVTVTLTSTSGPACPHGYDIDVMPGSNVTVQIVSDTAVAVGYLVSTMESTTSAAGHSTASIGTLHAGFDDPSTNNTGNVRNKMTTIGAGTPRYILVDRIVGGILSGSPAIAAGQTLYQFVVAVPGDAVFCDTWTIDIAVGFPVAGPSAPVGYSHMMDAVVVAGGVTPLVVHAIPEPATIALMGLGGLLLCRRRRK